MTSGAKKTLWVVGVLVVLGLALPVSNLRRGPALGHCVDGGTAEGRADREGGPRSSRAAVRAATSPA